MMKKRVVITGLGALTPVGNNIEETWSNLVQGVSGVDLIKNFDTSALPVKIAAQVKNFKPEEHFDPKEVRKMDTYTHYALVASREAIKDAGLMPYTGDNWRIGVITGVGIGGIYTFEEECIKNHELGPRR
ncbi:MAG: beta-ketoacyl-[acyl-carrier-protein] synthase II, partial [Candidatus Cloacimonetes bacterium]|nr:beta-ketoacyl-[acyl-carrier-protein] synthase II [Candidatus Cloacimonadota bacterium]